MKLIILTLFLNNFNTSNDSLIIKSENKARKYELESNYITLKTKNNLQFRGEIVEITNLNVLLVNCKTSSYATFPIDNSKNKEKTITKCDTISINKKQIKTIEIFTGTKHEKNHSKYLKNLKIRYVVGLLICITILLSKFLLLLPTHLILVISISLLSMVVFDLVRNFYYRKKNRTVKINNNDELIFKKMN